MVTLLVGENSFENERLLRKLVGSFDGLPEVFDGADLTVAQLPDLLMGTTLFAANRMVVIKNLSDNKAIWSELPLWLERVNDYIHLVLIEAKPDKRTKTFKDLQKKAKVHESKLWSERDRGEAQKWVIDEAKRIGFKLDQESARLLIERVGLDQWLLFQSLEKLAVVDEITPQTIELLIDANPTENIFLLFEAALRGDTLKVRKVLDSLKLVEDAYQLLGLLSGQAVQLAMIAVADKPNDEVAKDLGIHPYVLSKLMPFARKLGRAGTRKTIEIFTEADGAVKTSAIDPWLLIERALTKVAHSS